MDGLAEKLILIMICMIGLISGNGNEAPVAASLFYISLSATVHIISDKRFSAFLIAAGAVLCIFFPIGLCALPLLLFDALRLEKWWLVLPASGGFIWHIQTLTTTQLLAIGIGCVSAVIIRIRIAELSNQVMNLTEMRDSITERNMQLNEQNVKLSQMQDTEVHLATMKERNRIAREIHDNVGHMLTRALLQSGALLVINKDETMQAPLEDLKSTLDTAMTSMRESVHTLHDDSVNLKKLIEDSILTVDKRFTVSLDYDLSRNTPGKIKLCMAGIIKEGLSNAVKHSKGDRIVLILREHPAFYQLVLEDNGPCQAIGETGIGLKNMTDRVRSTGGQISFTPSENGFRIFASIPKEKS